MSWILNDNALSGEIPAELGSLSNLTWLYLNDNDLSGEIPAELGSLSNLTTLYLVLQRLERGDTGGAGQPLQPGTLDLSTTSRYATLPTWKGCTSTKTT